MSPIFEVLKSEKMSLSGFQITISEIDNVRYREETKREDIYTHRYYMLNFEVFLPTT